MVNNEIYDSKTNQATFINYRLGWDWLRLAPLVARPEYLNDKILVMIDNNMEIEV